MTTRSHAKSGYVYNYAYNPTINSRDCNLCGGTGTVDVIPYRTGANDAVSEECPHCFRRSIPRTRSNSHSRKTK